MTQSTDSRVRIAALIEQFRLDPATEPKLRALADLVANDPWAPTTVRGHDLIVDDHLADSLVALDLPQVRAATAVVDIGSCARFPGVALAIALPESRVSLVDGNSRKCAFLPRAIAAGGLNNVGVVHIRAGSWAEGRGGVQ